MASNPSFVQLILDQTADAGAVEARKMFGDYTLYCDGKVVGLISDNALFIKPTDAGREQLRSVSLRPPYPGAKEHFYIEEVDDHTYLSHLVRITARALPAPKPKKKASKPSAS